VRKFLLATIALIALVSPATAADLGRFQIAPAPVVPVWTWTGCYAGGQVGYLWGSSEKWIVRTPGGDFFGQSLGGHDAKSWIGGVQAGCDYQFAGVVLGVQGDYGWTEANGTHASAREVGVYYHSEARALASVTGRIGYAWNRFLGYVKGGAAWERVDYSAATILIGTAYTASVTRPGWTIGVGGEYAFTKFLSGFVEYGYYDFGTSDIHLTPAVAGLRPAFVAIEETASVVRAGINLRFGG
jgi:outer membrane immunogenic protein